MFLSLYFSYFMYKHSRIWILEQWALIIYQYDTIINVTQESLHRLNKHSIDFEISLNKASNLPISQKLIYIIFILLNVLHTVRENGSFRDGENSLFEAVFMFVFVSRRSLAPGLVSGPGRGAGLGWRCPAVLVSLGAAAGRTDGCGRGDERELAPSRPEQEELLSGTGGNVL